jgi:hypothetical protein
VAEIGVFRVARVGAGTPQNVRHFAHPLDRHDGAEQDRQLEAGRHELMAAERSKQYTASVIPFADRQQRSGETDRWLRRCSS